MFAVNDIIYDPIFMHSTDKAILTKATNWGKAIVDKNPDAIEEIDTYANLLYKISRKKDAIEWETNAITLKQAQIQNMEDSNKKNEGKPGRTYYAPGYLASKKKQLSEMETTLQKIKDNKPTWSEQ